MEESSTIKEEPTPLVNSATKVWAYFSLIDISGDGASLDGSLVIDLAKRDVKIELFSQANQTLTELVQRTLHQEMLSSYSESQLAELVPRYGMGWAGANVVGTGWQSNGAAMLALAKVADQLTTKAARFAILSVSLDQDK